MSEHDEQVALVNWARAMSGQIPELELLYANPLGGKRAWKTARNLKAEGVRAGVPDLTLPVASRGYYGLYIEMKYGHNRPTKPQQWWLEKLREQGHHATVCYGFESARDTILWYLEKGDNCNG